MDTVESPQPTSASPDSDSLLRISATLARELDDARRQLSQCRDNLESTQKALVEARAELDTCRARCREFESNWAAAASAAMKATDQKIVAEGEERASGTKASVYLLLLVLVIGLAAVLSYKGRLLLRGATSPLAVAQFCVAAGVCQSPSPAAPQPSLHTDASFSPLSNSPSCGLDSAGTCSASSFML